MSEPQVYDLYSDAFRARAHAVYAELRAADPVHLQPGLDGQTKIWFVTRAAEVERVLSDSAAFARDPARVSPGLAARYAAPDTPVRAITDSHVLNYDGADHRRLRGLVSKAFTPRVVEALRPRVGQIADELIGRVAAQGQMDLVADYAFPLPITVIAELIGVPTDRQDDFRRWSDAFVTPQLTAAQQEAAFGQLLEFAAYMRALVAERRQAPRADLLSALIAAEEQGDRLSEEELLSMTVLLIVAGHETTVALIGNAVLALLQHPPALAALRADPARIPAAVEEALRYEAPVERALTRFVVHDLELAGRQLRAGDLVIAVIGAANRDPGRFAQPDEFDIGRAPSPHLAFGKGIHACLGAPLARLEAEVALRLLIARCPGLRLAEAPPQLAWRAVPLFRSLLRLPVAWEA